MKNILTSILLIAIFLVLFPPSALAKKVLVNDKTGTTYTLKSDPESDSNVESAAPEETVNETRTPYKEAEDGIALRKLRRVGIGLQAAGAMGLWGAILDLNFAPQISVSTGYGGGQGFQSFELQGKYVLTGSWLMPYMTFGYARWSSTSSGTIEKTNPPILGDRLLNDGEKASGEFVKNLFYPGIGLQFMQLNGEWAGTSIYAEMTVLLDVGNAVAAPTGALGISYYF